MKLPGCADVAVQVCTQWLYNERLHMSKTVEPRTVFEKNFLMEGYPLGDYLDDFKYQDAILDALRSWVERASNPERAALLEE